MDEVRSYVRSDLSPVCRQGRLKDCSTSSSNPMMEGPGADSEEKHEPASDINTVGVHSLKRSTRNAQLEKKHEPASDINTVVVDSLKRLTRNGRLEKQTYLESG